MLDLAMETAGSAPLGRRIVSTPSHNCLRVPLQPEAAPTGWCLPLRVTCMLFFCSVVLPYPNNPISGTGLPPRARVHAKRNSLSALGGIIVPRADAAPRPRSVLFRDVSDLPFGISIQLTIFLILTH